jgi:hypothetical protein
MLMYSFAVINPEPRTPFDFSGINIRSLAENENNSAHRLALARMQINRVHMPSMRQPLIHLAQQQEQPLFEDYDDNESYGSFGPPVEGNRLSTITEKTELRTVDSRSHVGYSPGRQEPATPRYSLTAQSLAAQNQRLSVRPLSHMTGMSASTMDYGNVIRRLAFFRFLTALSIVQRVTFHTKRRNLLLQILTRFHPHLPSQLFSDSP